MQAKIWKWNIFQPFVEKKCTLAQSFQLLPSLRGTLFSSSLNSLSKLVLLCCLPSSSYPSAVCKMYFPFPFCLYFTFFSLTAGDSEENEEYIGCSTEETCTGQHILLFFITAWQYWIIASYKPLEVANLTVKLHIPLTELFFQTVMFMYQDLFEFQSCSPKCLLSFPGLQNWKW